MPILTYELSLHPLRFAKILLNPMINQIYGKMLSIHLFLTLTGSLVEYSYLNMIDVMNKNFVLH